MNNTGILIASPSSGCGKTTITLGLLRALSRKNVVYGAKSGPDYIDPRFHEAACGKPCINLDAWAMSPARLRQLARGDGFLIVEGAMGLFDGAPPDGKGSAADLAGHLGIPVILVVDCTGLSQSVAALVHGYASHMSDIHIQGIILNRVGSIRHETVLRHALKNAAGPPVIGAIPRLPEISQPSRHLGLIQAQERTDLNDWLETVADVMTAHIDLGAITGAPLTIRDLSPSRNVPPAQRIAIAQDAAFSFVYPHILSDWQSQGAEIEFFSPLNNDQVPKADYIYLPGGYPELHAEQLAANSKFLESLRNASQISDIYGECGGYMALGTSLTDANGKTHAMAGLLNLETSFAQRKLHLGYRNLTSQGRMKGHYKGHEFHYATTLRATGKPLFSATDAEDKILPPMGLQQGRVAGSFAHIIEHVSP